MLHTVGFDVEDAISYSEKILAWIVFDLQKLAYFDHVILQVALMVLTDIFAFDFALMYIEEDK